MIFTQFIKTLVVSTILAFSIVSFAEDNPYDALDSNSSSATVPALGVASCPDCVKHYRDVNQPTLALDRKHNCYPLGNCITATGSSSSSKSDESVDTGR